MFDGQLPLQRSVLRRAIGMCAQVIAKGKLVADVVMTGGICMDVMRSPVRAILAEVEATRYSGNHSVETLAANSVPHASIAALKRSIVIVSRRTTRMSIVGFAGRSGTEVLPT